MRPARFFDSMNGRDPVHSPQSPMRESKIAGSEPKRRLLTAAEFLFAERGFDAVSLRDIVKAAKANVAAVNYHFGGREELIELIITRYLTPILDERLARLESAERRGPGKIPLLEEVLEAYVRPLNGMIRKSELPETIFLKLLGRILAARGDAFFPEALDHRIKLLSHRFTRALVKCLPGAPAEDLPSRLHLIDGALIHLLLRPELVGDAGGTPIDAALGRMIRFAAAGLREGTDEPAPKGPQVLFDF